MNKPRGKLVGADAMGDLYFFWSIERVAVIYGLKTIEGKDWYGWGSEVIVANQKTDGSWQEWYPGIPDTCFALLFLKRANLARDLTTKLAFGNRKELGSMDNLDAGSADASPTKGSKLQLSEGKLVPTEPPGKLK